ncbi:MAG: MFS transporter [Anaerolineales bacterium]|nr:MFS transporter [Anaerolineales bacterium]
MVIKNRHRWLAVAIFFLFMLLHQTDRLLIGPLTSAIMAEFNLTEVQMGGIITGSLILGSVFYPIWGFLYDRFARPKLLALASFIWGITTWLSAIAPTARLFLISRASTGIDDSSYPGIASLISDYFPPEKRSRLFGFLQISIPLGYLLGLLLALTLGETIGWRMIYIITGLIGLFLSILIYFGVKDVPRGSSEPELSSAVEIKLTQFSFSQLLDLIKIPTLRYLFIQGFIGVIPWQVITFWSFRYLEVERNYTSQTISSIMIPAVLFIGAGYFAGGLLGDAFYSKFARGRLYVSIAGVVFGALFLTFTLNIPVENIDSFRVFLAITSFFIPLASPNIASTVYDIVLPEIRSTATSIQYFLGNLGSAFAPLLAGAIGQKYSLETALLSISLIAWLVTGSILVLSAYYLPEDMNKMRQTLRLRASMSEPEN